MLRVVSAALSWPAASVLTFSLLLGGCATTGPTAFTQTGRVGPDDGSDSCHAQAVALDNTGDFFGQDILTGAAVGAAGGAILGGVIGGNWQGALEGAAAGGVVGAAGGYWEALQQQHEDEAQLDATVSNNLTQENAQINQTQLAFNNDMDCRFGQAQTIRAQYAANAITLAQAQTQMAQVKAWAQRDLALAQTINSQIQSRGAQFDTAVTNLSNGAPAPETETSDSLDEPAAIREDTPVYLRPDPSAPVVGQLTRHEPVTLTATSNGYALVQADDGTRGFAPIDTVGKPGSHHHIYQQTAAIPQGGTPVQQLDGSNAASRDAFAQSVSVSQSAVANGFQMAS
jgi:hypothetical protein